MDIKTVRLVYFSATGTTQKVLESIAKGVESDTIEHHNLTLPGDTPETIPAASNELVMIGAPVYGGRLPEEAVKRLRRLKADKTPAVLIVLYGNREFEDALLELKNLSVERGCIPVAGGAFIGEHSFSTAHRPIAEGRPDNRDVEKAVAFGKSIKQKISNAAALDDLPELKVPGAYPYEAKGARPMEAAPVTDTEKCTVCGTCAEVCPTAAISVADAVTTEIPLCIRCCACIRACPEDARRFENEMMEKISTWLYENYSVRKEPELFE